MQILFLMADGFEETEFVTPFDYLQRAGIDVALASVSGKAEVVGLRGLRIQTDFALSGADTAAFDGVLLPGGGIGVKNLKASAEVVKIIYIERLYEFAFVFKLFHTCSSFLNVILTYTNSHLTPMMIVGIVCPFLFHPTISAGMMLQCPCDQSLWRRWVSLNDAFMIVLF